LSLHYHADNITFDVAVFYNRLDHYIYIAPSVDTTAEGISIYKYQQSNAKLYGFEAGFHIHPKQFDWLHFETTFSNVTGKKENGEYLPFIPANKFQSELRFEIDKMGFLKDVFFKIGSVTAFNQSNPAPEEENTDGYTLIDMGIGGNIKVSNQLISFVLSVNNVFDKKYVDHLSTLKEVNYFNPGRNITFSLKVPFGIK
jgi:iron complex outermembrane recepter protein